MTDTAGMFDPDAPGPSHLRITVHPTREAALDAFARDYPERQYGGDYNALTPEKQAKTHELSRMVADSMRKIADPTYEHIILNDRLYLVADESYADLTHLYLVGLFLPNYEYMQDGEESWIEKRA